MKKFVAPLLITTLGVAWLLTALQILPSVNWVWVLGLAIAGILVLALGGLTRTTFVLGPFLIICAGFSIARQAGKVSQVVELPVLVIIFGALSLFAAMVPLRDANTKP